MGDCCTHSNGTLLKNLCRMEKNPLPLALVFPWDYTAHHH